jgi:glycosyltransferase involved in cell wall biosynthesis
MPQVSVVIPCFAQAHFLSDAIESVLGQTFTDYEIIVIDDGSPDNVRAVVERFPMVRLIAQENRGLSQARNRGLAECTGTYVVCLDADDRLLPNALAAGVRAFAERPECGFVWGRRRRIDVSGNPVPSSPLIVEGPARYDLLLRQNIVGPPVTVMFRRAVLAELGGFAAEQHHSEDYEMYMRVARTFPTWCHQELIAEYRVHDANMSRNHRGMLAGNLLALDRQVPFVGSDPVLSRALREGRRIAWEREDCGPRLDELSRNVRSGRWLLAARGGLALLFKYPRKFLSILARQIIRFFLPSRAKSPASQPAVLE